ncbi:MAG: phage tail tape measure protein [Bacteroidota bacterium]
MNNILEFFIKMRDLTPPQIAKTVENVRRIEKTADMASRSLQGTTDRLRQMGNSDPSSGPVNGISKIRRETEKLNSELAKTTGGGGSSGGGLLGRLVKGFIVGAALTAIIGFGKGAAQSAIQFEQTNKSFEVLTGNKGIGGTLAGELNTLQQQTVLGPEVFKNAQTMMGFGIGADKVVDNLKMLGEVSMGDVDRFKMLTLAFSQVQAAGKLMGQDLLQFINAGFNPLQEISKNTGISMADLKKKMEDGAISADMVTQAFKSATGQGGLFNGMLDQMAETTGGKIAQLQGSFEAMKIAIGDRMRPAINWFVGGLTNIVNKVRIWFEIPLEKKLGDQILKIQSLQAQITASNTSHERQVQLLRELEQINPNIVKGIDEQNISYAKLAENINNVTGALRNKIFLEKFDKANAGTLTDFAKAQQKANEAFGSVMTAVAMADPSLAQRTDLTIGQKQLAARKILQDRIAKDPSGGRIEKTNRRGDFTGWEYSQDYKMLGQLQKGVQDNNSAVSIIGKLQPKMNEINATKDALAKQIDQFTGVKSMTAANISVSSKGGGGGTGGGIGSGTGGTVASGITGAGPRVVNISGVNMKLADTMTVNATNGDDFLKQVEPKLEDFFLRILNSGASVQ